MTSALSYPNTDVLTGQIQQALLSREVIAQAQGRLMERDRVSSAAAYRLLLDASSRTGEPLREVCERIVTSPGPSGRDSTGSASGSRDGSADGRPTP